ncbi:hypothetical protein BJ508DRAFT_329441 [Ascobolus immersus RN42]|uniref:Uncharacterized protein n=1 Tax=Ascobolus immersus RN42 TaxID=1160509 RepID=A0A3N4HWX1_ASCIM|nr:hypothetical protein BJ508DRAFT_329441 [Ascobolus immersus RN42]
MDTWEIVEALGWDFDDQEKHERYINLKRDVKRDSMDYLSFDKTYKQLEKEDPMLLHRVEYSILKEYRQKQIPNWNSKNVSRVLCEVLSFGRKDDRYLNRCAEHGVTKGQVNDLRVKYPHISSDEIFAKLKSGDIQPPISRREANRNDTDIWGKALSSKIIKCREDRKKARMRRAQESVTVRSGPQGLQVEGAVRLHQWDGLRWISLVTIFVLLCWCLGLDWTTGHEVDLLG